MPPKKATGESPAQPSTAATAVTTTTAKRQPWKKKTVLESIQGQVEKMRADVARKEEELKQSKQQLQKLDEVLKALEST